jgi:hypothetical protein
MSKDRTFQVGVVIEVTTRDVQSDRDEIKAVRAALTRAMNLEVGKGREITERVSRGTTFWEGLWLAERRVLRLGLSRKPSGERTVSVALGRQAYQAEFLEASLGLQTRIHHPDRSSAFIPGAFDILVESMRLVPSAHAQMAPAACTAICPPPPAGATCQINKTSCLSNQIASIANSQGTAANANWADTNALISDFTAPGHALIWGAAGASGAMLGAVAVGAALDGIAAGGSAIWESITHARTEAEIVSSFKTARERWEKMGSEARDLERTIDLAISLHDVSRELLSSEELKKAENAGEFPGQTLRRLMREELVELEARRKIATESYEEGLRTRGTGDRACASRIATLDAEIQTLKSLQGNILESMSSDAEWCKDLKRKMDQVRIVEGQLQQVRSKVLGTEEGMSRSNREVFEGYLGDQQDEAAQRLARSDEIDAKNHALGSSLERAEELYEKQTRLARDTRARWVDRCMSEASVPVLRAIPFIGTPLKLRHKKECEAKFRGLPVYQAYERQLRDAAAARDIAQQSAKAAYGKGSQSRGAVQVSATVHAEELAAYRSWFAELELEQDCLSNPDSCVGEGLEASLVGKIRALQQKGQRLGERCSQWN